VAIKRVGLGGMTTKAREAVVEAAKLMAQLRHAHSVPHLHWELTPLSDALYIVMESSDGPNLHYYIHGACLSLTRQPLVLLTFVR